MADRTNNFAFEYAVAPRMSQALPCSFFLRAKFTECNISVSYCPWVRWNIFKGKVFANLLFSRTLTQSPTFWSSTRQREDGVVWPSTSPTVGKNHAMFSLNFMCSYVQSVCFSNLQILCPHSGINQTYILQQVHLLVDEKFTWTIVLFIISPQT